jgi:hypothetical protein
MIESTDARLANQNIGIGFAHEVLTAIDTLLL